MFSQNTFDAFDYDWILEKCIFTVTKFNDNLGFVKIAIFSHKKRLPLGSLFLCQRRDLNHVRKPRRWLSSTSSKTGRFLDSFLPSPTRQKGMHANPSFCAKKEPPKRVVLFWHRRRLNYDSARAERARGQAPARCRWQRKGGRLFRSGRKTGGPA